MVAIGVLRYYVSVCININNKISFFCMKDILYNIGQHGPSILFISSIYLLWKKKLFLYYLVGFVVNIFLNIFLKITIQQPRPSVNEKKFDLLLQQSKNNNMYKKLILLSSLGMPSGHAQSVFYSTLFIFLVFKQNNLFYLLVSFITLYQRVQYEFHTVLQVIIGSALGGIFGFIMYSFAMYKIKGKLKHKLDDYGPI